MTATIPAFRALPSEMQQAAGAAAALMLTLFLPWYSAVFRGENESFNRSAFGEFSFVEAAVLLVAVAVLYLVWARSQRKAFHLPGGDGTVIMGAGAWAVPADRLAAVRHARGRQRRVRAAVGHLRRARGRGAADGGGRARARGAPPGAAEPGRGGRRLGAPAARRAVARAAAARDDRGAEALRERPGWEGEPPEAPGRAERPGAVAARDDGRRRRAGARA